MYAVGFVRRVIADVGERLGPEPELVIDPPVLVGEVGRLVEKTLKQRAATLPLCRGNVWKMLVKRNSTALVFVARPDTPLILRWAASGPSRKSQSR
jgi:hypothetical protein